MNFIVFTFVLGCLAHHSHSFSLSDIQPIIGFSDTCTAAYDTTITNCNPRTLAPLSSDASCSDDCHTELQGLTTAIQTACRGNGANPDTIVGHAFVGDMADFLCAEGKYAAGPVPAISTGSATNAISSTSDSAATTTSQSDSASSTATSSPSTTQTSSSSSSSQSSSTTLTPSTTSSSSSSTSKTESPQSTSSSSNSISDSTPFDQTVGKSAAASLFRQPSSSHWLVALGVIALAIL